MAQNLVKIIDRFFFSYTEEELWLNEMAEKGWLLSKKSFYRYFFVPTDEKFVISVQILDTPLQRDENKKFSAYCAALGEELIDTYKCRAYFKKKVDGETRVTEKTVKHNFDLKFKHTLQYLIFTSIAFVVSAILLCYQCSKWLFFESEGIVITISELSAKGWLYKIFANLARLFNLDTVFGDNATTVMILYMFVLVLIASVFLAAYINDIITLQSSKKKMLAAVERVDEPQSKKSAKNKL